MCEVGSFNQVIEAGTDTIDHDPTQLVAIFNTLFESSENTRLVRGDDEPVYLPADDQRSFNQIIFAHGFFSSALHEIAHWCLAGKQRRKLLDYGYWYAPDGRSQQQQAKFEQVEIKPQALEWIFSKTCRKNFRVSVDNLNGVDSDPLPFQHAVYQQVISYCSRGLPNRADLFRQALASHYATPLVLSAADFQLQEIAR